MRKYVPITLVIFVFFIVSYVKNQLDSDSNATPLPTPIPTLNGKTTNGASGLYRDGTYDGSVEDAVYGLYQVSAVISGGKLSDITLLKSPDDNPTSVSINSQAFAIAKNEAIQKQNAQVDIITGASDSVPAFSRSLETALNKAKK